MTDDRFKRYQEAGNDFLETARARAEDFLRELAKATESTQKQAQGQVDELVAAGRRGTDQMIDLVRREVESQLSQLGVVTKGEFGPGGEEGVGHEVSLAGEEGVGYQGGGEVVIPGQVVFSDQVCGQEGHRQEEPGEEDDGQEDPGEEVGGHQGDGPRDQGVGHQFVQLTPTRPAPVSARHRP